MHVLMCQVGTRVPRTIRRHKKDCRLDVDPYPPHRNDLSALCTLCICCQTLPHPVHSECTGGCRLLALRDDCDASRDNSDELRYEADCIWCNRNARICCAYEAGGVVDEVWPRDADRCRRVLQHRRLIREYAKRGRMMHSDSPPV